VSDKFEKINVNGCIPFNDIKELEFCTQNIYECKLYFFNLTKIYRWLGTKQIKHRSSLYNAW
jgi:hypothetical protein